MARYQLNHAYSAFRDGQRFGPWVAGDVVELTEQDAAWMNRDSPGCLTTPADEPPADDPPADDPPARRKPAGANRQRRGGADRNSS